METKLFTILDRCTEIQAIATKMVSDNPLEIRILRNAGYGRDIDCILLAYASCGGGTHDPRGWNNDGRTMRVAHNYIQANWDKLESGASIDVRDILGEDNNACL